MLAKNAKLSRVEKMNKLLELLMIMDRDLPWKDFYAEHGSELFPMFFKMTYYGEGIDHSVFNSAKKKGKDDKELAMEEVITDNDNLGFIIGQFKRVESQINYVINNFLLKQIRAVKDKMRLLIGMAALLYQGGGHKHSKRVGKIMMLFGKMISVMYEQKEGHNDKSKFLQGSLYALGGLCKTECKSFLMTLNENFQKNPEQNN